MKTRLIVGVSILAALLAACSPAPTPETATDEPMATAEATSAEAPVTEGVTSMSGAGDLRVALNALLGEHALLALNATDAALRGSDAEFQAAAAALDENSVAISNAIGSVYGQDAGDAFLALWRTHIGFFVDYTTGVATNDQAMKNQAVADLTTYIGDFSAFLAGANPNLTVDAVSGLLGPHVSTLASTVDAQAAGDYVTAYANLRASYAHTQMIADALANAIALQFPDQFTGDALSPAVDLRVAVNNLLAEHTFIASMATKAALGGRSDEFEAAAASLDENSVALGGAIGSVYGEDAGNAFLELWRTHIGFFVDYTNGVATNDQAAKDQAVADLTTYIGDFSAFLAGANPNLTVDAVSSLLGPHVTTLAATVDAQGAQDWTAAYTNLREAFAHMQMIADPLAEAIVIQFPENFQ
jgi:hypothetical protein